MARAPRVVPLLAVALLIASVAFAVMGVLSLRTGADQALAQGTTAPGVSTPLLSARRTLELLAQPVAANRLNAALAPVVAQLPPTSCFRVSDGATTLYDLRGTDAYMPASNLKLVTAYAALELLGADTKFSTDVVAGSGPEGGRIDGDLYLVGKGDPLITTDPYLPTIKYGTPPHTKLESIADSIVAAGVTHVTGGVRGDESRYDTQRTVPTWSPGYLSAGDVAPLSALSVNDTKAYPAAGPVSGVVKFAPDPAAYAASVLTDLLRARGVVVDGAPSAGIAPEGAHTISSTPSLTVKQIVDEMLMWSDNNTSELLVKEIGHAKAGEGTTVAGATVIRDLLDHSGFDVTGFEMVDGSGLARGNKLSCATLTQVLAADGVDGVISSGLPIAGSNGTLSKRYRDSPAASKVKAKTGTLRDVNSLTGWVSTDEGRPLVFSIISQTGDVAGQRLVDQHLTEAMLSYPDAPDLDSLAPPPAPTK